MKGVLSALCLVAACWGNAADAHKASDSYLSLKVQETVIDGRWDIALRDLDFAIGLDADGNGELTWDEVRIKHDEISAYAMSRLRLSGNGGACALTVGEHLIDAHTDGAYAVLRFRAICSGPVEQLTVEYRLLFDLDSQHRGLLKLERETITSSAIFGPENSVQSFSAARPEQFGRWLDFIRSGIWHIWIGFDHILFLLSLLIPAVLVRSGRKWVPATGFKVALVDVLKIVTAFTLAHSITFTLAALQVVSLPSRWVESAIAASVVLAALNNVMPVPIRRRWVAALVFGLIHGFGFASVLSDLGLQDGALVIGMIGFNVGVELGQLAIVAIFLPVAFALRGSWFYRRGVMIGGSGLIAVIASLWFAERAFNLSPILR